MATPKAISETASTKRTVRILLKLIDAMINIVKLV